MISALKSKGNPALVAAAAASVAAGSVAGCSDDHVPSLDVGWSHHGPMASFDSTSVRRGFQVYKEVCASCHSLNRIAFRNLVEYGAWGEAEVKVIAEDEDVVDGPNDQGDMFERPGKLSDPLPSPYANEEAARAANGGAYPPDLSLMVKARHAGVDYIFNLLTGYCEPPQGKEVLSGLYYNPYFSGAAIAMPPPLQDGQVEYPDGTPATTSQMAKDISVFLAWAAEPEHDDRKKSGRKWIFALSIGAVITGFYKRFRWAPLKTRQISYVN
jgi:ubiquinol-cytochrome c reductase cytochrome c1 subunit